MQAKRFTVEQILAILKAGEAPQNKVIDVYRAHGISDKSYYQWRKRYGGVEEAKALGELKQLRDENARLKKPVAEKALDIGFVKEANAKKW